MFLYKSELSSFYLVTFGFVIFGSKILYEKRPRKMLMKLKAGVNSTNVLQAAYTCSTPKSAKRN